jgi:hypothetical protein
MRQTTTNILLKSIAADRNLDVISRHNRYDLLQKQPLSLAFIFFLPLNEPSYAILRKVN